MAHLVPDGQDDGIVVGNQVRVDGGSTPVGQALQVESPRYRTSVCGCLIKVITKSDPGLRFLFVAVIKNINLYLKTLELLQALIVLRQELVKLVHSSTKTVALNNC